MVTAVLAFTSASWAADEVAQLTDPGEPATPDVAEKPQPAQAEVEVLEVSGRAAQFRTADDQPWQKLTTESKLGVGSEVRTLPATTVKLRVGPNNFVTIEGIGVLAIGDLVVDEDSKVITAMLAQKYGRMNIDVKHVGDFRNDTRVATPGRVMAVKGTNFNTNTFGSFQTVKGNEGAVNVNGHLVGSGDESSNKSADPNKNASKKNNPDNTSVPGSDGNNSTGNGSNYGYAGLGAGEAKGTGDAYNSWTQSVEMFNGRIPQDDAPGTGDDNPGPKY